MKVRPSRRNAPIALGASLALVSALATAPAAPVAAAALPRLEADAIGGNHVVLPTDAAGKPLVILLAFTRESEGDLKSWSRKLLEDHMVQNAAVYVVVVADKIAFTSRRHIRKVVEGSAVGTKSQIDNNVLITFSGDAWRALTPPGDKHTAGIVVCDGSGNVVLAKREPYNDANLSDVEKAAK